MTKAILSRKFKGTVTSDKMQKTLVVVVDRLVWNKKYKKQYHKKTKLKVHDEKGLAKEGDLVMVAECRPMSKEKRWRLIEVIK